MTDSNNMNKVYLVIHHLVSTTTSVTKLRSELKQFMPFVQNVTNNATGSDKVGTTICSISQVLEILLAYLPETIAPIELFSVASELLEDYNDGKDSEIANFDDVLRDFEENLPQLKYIYGFSETDITERSVNLFKATRDQSSLFNWSVSDASTDPFSLFYNYVRSTIFKINLIIDDVSLIDSTIDKLTKLPYVSDESLNWINGFYKPVSILSVFCTTPLVLIEWDKMLESDKINFVMNLAVDMKQISNIVSKTLVPHLKYSSQEESYQYFINWLQSFGDQNILNINNSNSARYQLQDNLQVILDMIREDSLLVSIQKYSESVLNQFVSTILSIIYLTPKVSLKIFITMKEILVILENLPLDTGSKIEYDFELPIKTQTKEMSKSMPSKPTVSLIKYIERLVETGERLYANELSLIEVFQLSRQSKQKQFQELEKFISNETQYGTSNSLKQWQTLLSSIYWIFNNTFIFSKISDQELDRMILGKLLNLKLFDIISDLFRKQFMKLNTSEFNDVVTKEAWKEYNLATNGDVTIGHMKTCTRCLQLVDDSTTKNHSKDTLIELISVATTLQNYKVYFQTGIPLTPKKINELDDPMKLITKILELNPEAYKNADTLFDILCKLIKCLHNESSNNLIEKDDLYEYAIESRSSNHSNPLYVKLELLCIDHASVNNDFKFSYNKSIELLNEAFNLSAKDDTTTKDLITSHWFTFLQITKNEYYDADTPTTSSVALKTEDYPKFNAIDTEHLEILMKLEILSMLLLIVPCEFNSNVIEQWLFIHQSQQQYEEDCKDRVVSDTPPQSDEYGSDSRFNLGSILNNTSKGGNHLSFQDRLQRSLNSAAFEVFNSNSSAQTSEQGSESSASRSAGGIGKNIVGWVIGAN